VGKFVLYRDAPGAITEDDVTVAEIIAGSIGFAVERTLSDEQAAGLLRREQQARKEAEALLAVIQAVTSAPDVTEGMRRMARALARALRADMVGAYLADADARWLRPVAGYRVPRALLEEFLSFPIPIHGHRLLEQLWQHPRLVWSDDIPAHPLVDRETVGRFPHQSDLFVPIVVGKQPIGGFFCVWWQERRRIGDDEIRLVEEISREAAVLVERAKLLGEAETANQAKDEFLAMLAHELRNPLNVIVNGISILDRTGGPDPDAERMRALIRRQVDHLARLLDDLLDVARISRGHIELRKEATDLRVAIDRAVEAQRHAMAARSQHFSATGFEAPVMVLGDPARLQQVVGNLLNNAAKYTPPGGRIDLSLAVEGDDAIVRVRDTGAGIAADDLRHVFDSFTRSRARPTPADGGLGLGLSLVKRLVELHGGSVRADSQGPGTGAEFVVRLPLAPPARAVADGPRVAPAAAVRPRSVVVIEDNDDGREALMTALRLDGHAVRGARSGREGVELVVTERPDVVLVDIGLPDIDGYEVGRRLRERIGPAVRLLALTGYGQAEDRRRTEAAGFDGHLVKPVAPEDVSRLLAET
jgi:signal transduction histidine kinase